jgi:hypothetical protein
VKREPNDLKSRDAGGVGAATCRACSENLAPDAAYCHSCGYAQVDDNWVECEISYRRDRLHGEFTAVYRGEAPWSVAGRSEQFLWVGRGGEPPRTAAAEDRLARLCRALEREGWKVYDAGPVEPWYRFTFGRGIGAPGHEPAADVHGTSDLEDQPNLTLVPVEEVAEPIEVAIADEPVEARLVRDEQAAQPVDVPVAEADVPVAEIYLPATEDYLPATEDYLPATEDYLPATEDYLPATEDYLPATEDYLPATEDYLPATEDYLPATEDYLPAAEEAPLVPFQQIRAAVPDPPMEALPVALEAPEHPHEPDPEPPVSLDDDVSGPPEDVVVGPWYRQPPKPAPVTALTEESELCSRISLYVAKAG